MFSSILLRNICRKDKYFSKFVQTLSIVDNGLSSQINPLETAQKNDQIHKMNAEVNESEKVRYIPTKSISSGVINSSEVLQELAKLNVQLYKVEENMEALEYLLKINVSDIKEHIILLKEFKLKDTEIGNIVTKNPMILKEDIEDLRVRINYLKYRKFTDNMIMHILKKNPFWLTYSTQEIDEFLGSIQNLLQLKGHEVRLLTMKCSKVVTQPIDKIKTNIFVLKEEMGFTADELKKVILRKPRLLTYGRDKTTKTFDYLHHSMNLSHDRIVQECEVLSCRESRLKHRHLYLEKLGRAQYDPKKPNYVSLKSLISESDTVFCNKVAKTAVHDFNLFLKSL